MRRTLTPDQFAMAWSRADGDRIPYPLAVRLSAADNVQRAAQLPALHRWCAEHLDADLEAALRVLARPELRAEVFGYGPAAPGTREPGAGDGQTDPFPSGFGTGPTDLGADPSGRGTGPRVPETGPSGRRTGPRVPETGLSGFGADPGGSGAGAARFRAEQTDAGLYQPDSGLGPPVRVLGAVAGEIAVVAAQAPGSARDRGGDIRIAVGSARTFAARLITPLPRNGPGALPALTAPLARVAEDSRDLVTVPVSGPSTPARIRRLLRAPRDGIGQIVVSVRRNAGALAPFGVLCWIDVAGDGRYAVRTGTEVEITPVTAESFAGRLRPMLTAAGRVAPRALW
ncbi:ESX secretion-associated protein EspG [Nocardia sp. NPDC057353]|uniref:ESX secretion-associated protein EspG n=1 Tax=Nocardia sp. NPDC057353 TaxID=3346104 RepID=UPI00362CFF42